MILALGATELLERHARLLFDLDADGRIVAVNEPEPDPPPMLWLARGHGAALLLARPDVPTDLAKRVVDLVRQLPAWTGDPLTADWTDQLAGLPGLASAELEGGPAFRFPEAVDRPPVDGLVLLDESSGALLETHFPFTRRHLDVRSPVAGVIRDGTVVAICMSCRTRPDAGEAGLYTQEPWRGRGFASALVARWRSAMDAAGRRPYYSTTWDNTASLAVARGLGLRPFGEELSLR